ncbi:hypothetical protein LPC08_04255 [Roseomonas sp. OT10]|uniref:hypothetical protein n=1 Tax=Roseomonas cutis TaxID=2897332 RepID=UPI001E3B6DDB|nr:hypothetical protein [Roseomonas sp. OT10]UFN49863.1 hypothetical protein LPC08_04255 [Roseomonas sp. OT10]
MFRTATAAALALALGSWAVSAEAQTMQPTGRDSHVSTTMPGMGASPADQSNSASARTTGGGMGATRTSRPGMGASPTDQSNSASARATPRVRVNRNVPVHGGPAINSSNSVSAAGGPGTGPVATRSQRRGTRATASADGVYMGGGGVFQRGPDGRLQPVN